MLIEGIEYICIAISIILVFGEIVRAPLIGQPYSPMIAIALALIAIYFRLNKEKDGD
jgi:hypothetical protein